MSRLGTIIRQKYSLPGGADETGSGVKYPMSALTRESKEEQLVRKMRQLRSQRAGVRGVQKWTGGLYADSL